MNSRRFSLLTLLCLAAPLGAQGAIDLRTTAKKGATVWLLQEQKQEQTIDMGGQEMETSQSTTRTVQVTVKDVDDKGDLTVETKIVRVRGGMVMPMGMGDFEFDSLTDKPSDDDEEDDTGMGLGNMSNMLKKMQMTGVGKSFTAKVSRYGKVVELTDGVDAILGEGAGGGAMMGGGGMSRDTLRQIVESAFGILSDKPVAVGAKWDHAQKEAGGQMPIEQKLELTLAKADADVFEITASGTVQKPGEGDDKADPAGAEGAEEAAMVREMLRSMKMKNGKITGSQKISRKDGFTIESSNVVSIDIEMESPMGEMAMSMKITNSTKRTTEAEALAKKSDKDEKKGAAK